MFGQSYKKVLESEAGTESKNRMKHSHLSQHFHNSKEDYSEAQYQSFDIVSASEMFQQRSYPIQLSSVNAFCPVCGKVVRSQDPHLTFQSKLHIKNFLAHRDCLNLETTQPMTGIFDEIQHAIIKTEQIRKDQKLVVNLPLGGRQFYVEIKITHPLSDYKFFSLSNKVPLIGQSILWDLIRKQQDFCFLPNLVCFPINDFKLTVFLSEMGISQNKTKFQVYVNLGKKKPSKNLRYLASTEDLSLSLEIIENPEDKQKIIDQMNFKYLFDKRLPLPLIKLVKLDIKLPQDFDEEQQQFQKSHHSNRVIVQDLLSQKNILSPDTKMSTGLANFSQNKLPSLNETYSDRSIQSQDVVDLEYLIETDKLKSYVCNNVRSRQFQNFLKEATPEQIDLIIQNLRRDVTELIMHEYANYMIQKLFTVCNQKQRIILMKEVKKDISALVKNKQGTHTIQSFISLFVSNEEFQLMCEAVQSDFAKLCCHPNATHFIQKIINIFPIQHTLRFYELAIRNFNIFATDKNAMCVLKYQMKKISQKKLQEFQEVKRRLIKCITKNTETIIQDSYGNYIVQFCYQFFGAQRSRGITQLILCKFAQFSMQKYSSSVVLKCVNQYWDIDTVESLKGLLSNEGIIEMYKNRDGSKILLELMEKYENTLVRQKIYTLLISGEPSRFYQERWGVALGSRSGQVGCQFSSFTEAALGNKALSSGSGSKSNKKKYNK